MGYFSRLSVDLLERQSDRELDIYDDESPDRPKSNQELAAQQQEAQYSIWNEQYRKQLETTATKSKAQPKVYQKTRGLK